MAASCVTELDAFRAPAPEAELTRRRAAELNATQETNLVTWSYPYVLDEFRFHITLSGRLSADRIDGVAVEIDTHLAPLLPAPVTLGGIALVCEDVNGRFHLIHRYAFSGSSTAKAAPTVSSIAPHCRSCGPETAPPAMASLPDPTAWQYPQASRRKPAISTGNPCTRQ